MIPSYLEERLKLVAFHFFVPFCCKFVNIYANSQQSLQMIAKCFVRNYDISWFANKILDLICCKDNAVQKDYLTSAINSNFIEVFFELLFQAIQYRKMMNQDKICRYRSAKNYFVSRFSLQLSFKKLFNILLYFKSTFRST